MQRKRTGNIEQRNSRKESEKLEYNEKEWELLKRLEFELRGVTLELWQNRQFPNVYYLVQRCDGIEEVNIPPEWAEAILKVKKVSLR